MAHLTQGEMIMGPRLDWKDIDKERYIIVTDKEVISLLEQWGIEPEGEVGIEEPPF